ncbi:MAG: MFS transporter [Pseudomonas marincola]
MSRDKLYFLMLSFGHFLDHFLTLIFATVAALTLYRDWGVSYADLLIYATPGFFAFGLFSLPAGWLADKWSRDGMIGVFFVGIGLASIGTSFSETPLQMGIGLFVIGMFAAIYHPVGLAIVTTRWRDTGMRIATVGVWGNLGVASAALITGFFIDNGGWELAFVVPGLISIGLGLAYIAMRWESIMQVSLDTEPSAPVKTSQEAHSYKALLIRISIIVFMTTAVSSIIFQATTFALPKIFDERMQNLAINITNAMTNVLGTGDGNVATIVGLLAFITFAVASMAQLVVGKSLDKYGPRRIFLVVAAIQLVFFSIMSGLTDGLALIVSFGFMIGVFGQIPINDYMIGKTASGKYRARIYGIRYVVSFSVLAASLPIISIVYENWGFDTLFKILAAAAALIILIVYMLPKRLPEPAAAQAPAE